MKNTNTISLAEHLLGTFADALAEVDCAIATIAEARIIPGELLGQFLEMQAGDGSITAKHLLNSIADGVCLCCLEKTTNKPDN
jgi:hypothetical protein